MTKHVMEFLRELEYVIQPPNEYDNNHHTLSHRVYAGREMLDLCVRYKEQRFHFELEEDDFDYPSVTISKIVDIMGIKGE